MPKRWVGAALAAAALAALAGGAGYWAGGRSHAAATAVATDASAVPATTHAAGASGGAAERKPLYYRNPMGLADTSPTPKKDPMGMDYLPVYADTDGQADAASTPGQVHINPDKVQMLGVRTDVVSRRALAQTLRVAARIEADERRSYAIAPKFEGYVERLYVNATGQPVSKGQALFEVYSPELVSAQREYVLAVESARAMQGSANEAHAGMQQLAEASLARLRNWDISEAQLRALARAGSGQRTLTLRSPVSGIVTEKKAQQGMRFMPGETLYQVVDLSSVWALAEVAEQDIGRLRVGAVARVSLAAYPDTVFEGRVGYIYPSVNRETRSLPVRIELNNPGQRLKPGMYAQMTLALGDTSAVLTVPDSAVVDSGTRQIVLVQSGEGRYAPREVKLGARGDGHVEVRAGLQEGEVVVVGANFLIDAESNLKAALSGFGPAGQSAATPAPASVGHSAVGRVDAVDAASNTVTLSHGPVASLKWPAMTMDFVLANPALLKDIAPGRQVAFEFVERKPGEWVITRLEVKP